MPLIFNRPKKIGRFSEPISDVKQMYQNQHNFHIPVMGTGHSVDTPIRVAHLGIDSVLSVVDDLLLERIRKHYAPQYDLPYQNIPRSREDGRAERITAYLETAQQIVKQKFDQLKQSPLFESSEKDRYFNMLPEAHPLKKMYQKISTLSDAEARKSLIEDLTARMKPGSIDVNIMAKVDNLKSGTDGKPLSAEFSDACAALRGYAQSSLSSALVLSAGFNPRLYNYIAEFKDFYRDSTGNIKKRIILKVSDFRSALIQGKYLAKKGLEVAEFRIESGLNCGGHAFASDGHLLPVLLQEFRDKRDQLAENFLPMVKQFYEAQGWEYPEVSEDQLKPAITVQGGLGTHGEMRRMLEAYEMDATGWGSPFLLVPEATCVDDPTTNLLADAGEDDLYLSNVSPLGVPFNNVRNSGSDAYKHERIEKGKPGSQCPKGYLVSNTEFTEEPICTASIQYQLLKINQIEETEMPAGKKEAQKQQVMEKSCLCDHLGNGALIKLGIVKPTFGKQAICPGPNIAWFDRTYSLDEMVDHIYGRRSSLVPQERPHMFAKEITMYVDYVEQQLQQSEGDEQATSKLKKMRKNLEKGMDVCLEISRSEAYGDENLSSLEETVIQQRERLRLLFEEPASLVSKNGKANQLAYAQ